MKFGNVCECVCERMTAIGRLNVYRISCMPCFYFRFIKLHRFADLRARSLSHTDCTQPAATAGAKERERKTLINIVVFHSHLIANNNHILEHTKQLLLNCHSFIFMLKLYFWRWWCRYRWCFCWLLFSFLFFIRVYYFQYIRTIICRVTSFLKLMVFFFVFFFFSGIGVCVCECRACSSIFEYMFDEQRDLSLIFDCVANMCLLRIRSTKQHNLKDDWWKSIRKTTATTVAVAAAKLTDQKMICQTSKFSSRRIYVQE